MAIGNHERFIKLVDEARSLTDTILPKPLNQEMKDSEKRDAIAVIDVREQDEYEMSHIPDAINLPKTVIEQYIESVVPNIRQKIVLYCREGYLSTLAAKSLQKMGYENVWVLKGGLNSWCEAGFALQDRKGKTVEDLEREIYEEEVVKI